MSCTFSSDEDAASGVDSRRGACGHYFSSLLVPGTSAGDHRLRGEPAARRDRLLCRAVVRVGVSGHRALPARRDAELRAAVDAVLDDVGDPGTVVSSVAEGADRLVVWRGLRRPGWDLTVVLPFPPDDYATDFVTAESQDEFARLLDAASEISPQTRLHSGGGGLTR
jgi:hypothetical protein